jgi:hypothetical protein
MNCARCGKEVGNLYCGKCREEISERERGAEHIPSEDLMILLAYDRKTKLYRYGCTVIECPCNMQNGWCSKATPSMAKDLIIDMLHEFDGDNCIKQWCG